MAAPCPHCSTTCLGCAAAQALPTSTPLLRRKPALERVRGGVTLRAAFDADGPRHSSEAQTLVYGYSAPDMYPDESTDSASSSSSTFSADSVLSSASSSPSTASHRTLGHKHSSASMVASAGDWRKDRRVRFELGPYQFELPKSGKKDLLEIEQVASEESDDDFVPMTEAECARWLE